MRRLCLLWIAACTGLTLLACESTGEPVTGYEALPADHILIDAWHVLLSNGVRSAIVYFDTMYMFEDSSKYHFVSLRIELFANSGQPTGTVTANRGVLDERSQLMVGNGNVHLVTVDGDRTIDTEEMFYDPTTRQLWSDSTTYLLESGRRYVGSSFRSDDAFQQFDIENPRAVSGGGAP